MWVWFSLMVDWSLCILGENKLHDHHHWWVHMRVWVWFSLMVDWSLRILGDIKLHNDHCWWVHMCVWVWFSLMVDWSLRILGEIKLQDHHCWCVHRCVWVWFIDSSTWFLVCYNSYHGVFKVVISFNVCRFSLLLHSSSSRPTHLWSSFFCTIWSCVHCLLFNYFVPLLPRNLT